MSNRREFLKRSAQAAGALAIGAYGAHFPAPAVAQELGVASKINIAHIGVARQGAFSVGNCKGQNQIAFADVNPAYLNALKKDHPDAQYYTDYREMLAKLGDKLDAVVVATPDHVHAPAAIAAMKLGLHCYSEKPLGHDIHQIRAMRKIAKDKKLITQMGTQIHAEDNFRRVVELVQAGAIGTVTDVKIWCANRYIGSKTPKPAPTPEGFNWDVWLGPAAERDFDERYVPGTWRHYWDFGNGAMGDMCCHYLDLPYWALGLTYPLSVETTSPNPVEDELCGWDLTAKFEFAPQPGAKAPLTLSWQDGQARPECLQELGVDKHGAGVLFFGTDGILFSTYYEHALLPKERFEGFERPAQSIPKSLGHHAEWIKAIQDGAAPDATTCNFEYSGKIAESALLGCFSYRCGQKLIYDSEKAQATNCPEAAKYFKQYYRPGWEV